ncbi:hypothetical protein VTK26DRAFT_1646 [Humicola hyalothermophila]
MVNQRRSSLSPVPGDAAGLSLRLSVEERTGRGSVVAGGFVPTIAEDERCGIAALNRPVERGKDESRPRAPVRDKVELVGPQC